MPTLRDVNEAYRNINTRMNLYGYTEEFGREMDAVIEEVIRAITEEHNVTRDEAGSLSPDTVLGEKAEAAFSKFQGIIAKENARF